MTDRHVSYAALQGFNEEKKISMYKHTLDKALSLACDQHGFVALNKMITEVDNPYYRDQLLDIVADNALSLSTDAYGNLVVQHVLNLNDLRSKQNIAVNLRGHCVDLSFNKYGSDVVLKLLEAEESLVVVEDLVACNRTRLLRLAKNEYGKGVVSMALKVTHKTKTNLFSGLMYKINPKSNIEAIETALKRLSEKDDDQLHIDDEKEIDWLQGFSALLTMNGSVSPVEEEVLNYNTGWIDPELHAQYDFVRQTKRPKHS